MLVGCNYYGLIMMLLLSVCALHFCNILCWEGGGGGGTEEERKKRRIHLFK